MAEYQWNIFWAELDPIKGAEQSGTRPVIVVSPEAINTYLPVVGALPLTSMKKGRRIYSTEVFLPKETTGLDRDSIAMAHQVRAISKNRFIRKCGKIDSPDIREEIKRSVEIFLDLL